MRPDDMWIKKVHAMPPVSCKAQEIKCRGLAIMSRIISEAAAHLIRNKLRPPMCKLMPLGAW